MTKDEALRIALETLEYAGPSWIDARQPAITAIKEALAQPEPVAWEQFYPDMGKPKLAYLPPTGSSENACYISPSTWVELTDDEIQSLDLSNYVQVVRIVQAKLKAKNT
jgi:hypothetical protein